MSIAARSTRTTWKGPLGTGSGTFDRGSSGALDGLDVTWAARTEQPGGRTSPEELAAAAHSSCFSMALALRLGEHDVSPEQLQVVATVTLDDVDGLPTITSSRLQIRARVPGLGADEFATVIEEAGALCPVSRLFTGAEISIDAQLEPT